MYEIYCKLRDQRGVRDADVVRETKITKSTFSDWKNGRSNPKQDKLQKIANYFGVTLDYLMTGASENNDSEDTLTAKDRRDITNDLNRIMEEISTGTDAPLYYNGTEVSDASVNLLKNAIEFALTETKKENKVKYNPNKNKGND